ncbi:MAG: hypothetical protein KF696_04540 [Planctomycetes bacterium]|nr:hypothetical protein [Planctomycetota bacterium]MCW8134241.1 hypothetical protein [Planctomycetota bacterium]
MGHTSEQPEEDPVSPELRRELLEAEALAAFAEMLLDQLGPHHPDTMLAVQEANSATRKLRKHYDNQEG